MKIDIHYCGQWNYKPRALSLREELNNHYKGTFDNFEINVIVIKMDIAKTDLEKYIKL